MRRVPSFRLPLPGHARLRLRNLARLHRARGRRLGPHRLGPWVSALLIADILPAVAIGLLAGPLVDRLSRKGLMIALGPRCARRSSACCPSRTSPGMIVVLAALAGVGTGFFRPAVYAGPAEPRRRPRPAARERADPERREPHLGDRPARWAARSWRPPARTPRTGSTRPRSSLSALLLVRIPGRRFQAGTAVSRGHWRDLLEGFSSCCAPGPCSPC